MCIMQSHQLQFILCKNTYIQLDCQILPKVCPASRKKLSDSPIFFMISWSLQRTCLFSRPIFEQFSHVSDVFPSLAIIFTAEEITATYSQQYHCLLLTKSTANYFHMFHMIFSLTVCTFFIRRITTTPHFMSVFPCSFRENVKKYIIISTGKVASKGFHTEKEVLNMWRRQCVKVSKHVWVMLLVVNKILPAWGNSSLLYR